MYYPVIKNKLNELKGLGAVVDTVSTMPIIELTDCKYDDFIKFMDMSFDKTNGYLKVNSCFIDIPSYLSNEVVNIFELNSAEKKYNFFIQIKEYFKAHQYQDFIPIISFDYSYSSERKSYRENIKLIKKIEASFEKFAIRIFCDYSYKNQDIDLLGQAFAFYDDDLRDKCYLIFDTDQHTMEYSFRLSKELLEDNLTKKIILLGEPFSNKHRTKTNNKCDILENRHIERINYFNTHTENDSVFEYGDFTIVNKIQSKLELEEGQGFLYYPFINYTTPEGNMCKFTADNKGDYEQYKDLCIRIVKNMPNFSAQHCKACEFIKAVVDDDKNKEKYKAGGTWKHQMIAHHITMMAELFI